VEPYDLSFIGELQMGTHDELKRKQGYYWQLIKNQDRAQGFASKLFNGA
jgi:hypothetical protein